jgi:hypothetical protein
VQDVEEELTQFQLAVDSGRGTGSGMQLTPSASLSRTTLLMLQCARIACRVLDRVSSHTTTRCYTAHDVLSFALSSCSV